MRIGTRAFTNISKIDSSTPFCLPSTLPHPSWPSLAPAITNGENRHPLSISCSILSFAYCSGWPAKYGPWTSGFSLTREFVKMQVLKPYPRPTRSKSLKVTPAPHSLCFNKRLWCTLLSQWLVPFSRLEVDLLGEICAFLNPDMYYQINLQKVMPVCNPLTVYVSFLYPDQQ